MRIFDIQKVCLAHEQQCYRIHNFMAASDGLQDGEKTMDLFLTIYIG